MPDRRNGFSLSSGVVKPDTHTAGKAEMENEYIQRGMFKPTMILTTLLFLLVAPEPDSQDIAEMTAYFLVPDNHSGLMASAEVITPVNEEHRN